VHHSFSKLEMILVVMSIKAKALEIDKIHFKTHLNIFVSNMLLALKIMNFDNMFLTNLFLLKKFKQGCIIYK
jgi:hypothetical protein